MFSTYLCLSLPRKRVALRFSQRLETWLDFFDLLMLFILYSTFSIHGKQEEFSLCNLPTAISRAGDCLHACFRRECIIHYNMEYVPPQNSNGPYKSVAAKTVDSVQLLRQGLKHLQQNIGQFSYKKTNFLTELHTFDVDDLHVPIHHKN